MADGEETMKVPSTPAPKPAEQPTLLTPPAQSPRLPTPENTGAALQFTSASQLSLPMQDLLSDALLASAPRMQFDGRTVPALGGIPLLAKLGQGGMGAVYFGVKVLLRQEVAVKVLPLHLAQAQPDMIARFVREAQIAAGITSNHLVHVTDVSESAGLFYLVMEFVKGQSGAACLKKLTQSGQPGMDEASALEMCIAATEGLAAAHARGVIHRDVKPDNILVPQDPKSGALVFAGAKIADLGLARAEDMGGASLTGAQAAMGTPGYMAPEQALNARKAGKSADVFSMGATLYALLSGAPPFKCETVTETIVATIQKPHEPLTARSPRVSAATAALVERCLMKEPAQRYVDASALLDALKVCRAALGSSESRQSAALETLVRLQAAPEVGQTLKPSSAPAVANLPQSGPPGSVPVAAAPARGKPWLAIAALVVLGVCGALWLGHNRGAPASTPAATPPPVAPVEFTIACGHEKIEWMTWAADQFAATPDGKNVKINIKARMPAEGIAGILQQDPDTTIFAPASSFFRETFVRSFKEKFKCDPIAREENVALTPLVYISFQDRYQEYTKKYAELNILTLQQAMLARNWGEIASRPEWGRFTFACSNPLEFNNGLTALSLMAYYFNKKDRELTVEDVQAPAFQEWCRAFTPAFEVRGSPAQMIKEMVLKGPSSYDMLLTYESAVITNLGNAEGRWGGVRVSYPKMNVWNDNPYYLLQAPWISAVKQKAASKFIDYLLTEAPQHELLKYGFRPGNPKVPILFPDSPFQKYKDLGLRVDVPIAVEVPHERVLDALRESARTWLDEKNKH